MKSVDKPETFGSAAARTAMYAAIRKAVKGTAWKQKQGVCFQQVGEWFIAGHCWMRKVDGEIRAFAEIMAKPMALDPMLWATMELEKNNDQPLSFRVWGSFTCGCPTLQSHPLPLASPDDTGTALVSALNEMLPKALHRLEVERFSDIARHSASEYDNWRMNETIVYALRHEGDLEGAIAFAKQCNRENQSGMYLSYTHPDPELAGKSVVVAVIKELTKPDQTDSDTAGTQTSDAEPATNKSWLTRVFGRTIQRNKNSPHQEENQ